MYTGRIDITLGRAGMQWSAMASDDLRALPTWSPGCFLHISSILPYCRLAGNVAAEDSTTRKRLILFPQICLKTPGDWGRVHHRTGQLRPGQCHVTQTWPSENKPCIGHSQNRGHHGDQTHTPLRVFQRLSLQSRIRTLNDFPAAG